jgi:anion-transporting  ArsA/GET3 family ATPase
MSSAQPDRLSEKRLSLVLGKGGVGKTTIAAAWALALSRRGKRVLLAQVNAKERLSQLLGVESITDQVVEVRPNLFAVNMTPDSALHEYALMVLRFEQLYKLVFENKMSKSFLRAIPGLDEWTMLGKIWFHAEEKRKDGQPKYDHLIVDCPATGHGIYFLRAPQIVIDVVPEGPLTDYAIKMRDMLEDKQKTAPIYVTLPEDMPINETIELRQASERDLRLAKGQVVVNALHPKIVEGASAEAFAKLANVPLKDPALAPFLEAGQRRLARRALQEGYLTRLDAAFQDIAKLYVPFFAARSFGFSEVEQIATLLERTWIDRVPTRSAR